MNEQIDAWVDLINHPMWDKHISDVFFLSRVCRTLVNLLFSLLRFTYLNLFFKLANTCVRRPLDNDNFVPLSGYYEGSKIATFQ